MFLLAFVFVSHLYHGYLQAADGGVFYVESGSSATFMVPMSFEDNSLTAGYSGAAVYAGGNVRMTRAIYDKTNIPKHF